MTWSAMGVKKSRVAFILTLLSVMLPTVRLVSRIHSNAIRSLSAWAAVPAGPPDPILGAFPHISCSLTF